MRNITRPALAVIAAAALAACAEAPKPVVQPTAHIAATAPVAEAPKVPEFQKLMDRHAIDFQVPRKGKAILVNIPSYELIAFEDGEPVLRSRVIVGKARHGDKTPVMDTETSVVRFRPSWRPTPLMIRRGQYADKVVPPGRRNPLGLLAIRLEPGSLIYLHGTNRPKLFQRDRRALSGGCIRVEEWDDLAAWVLGIDVDEVHAHAKGRRTFDMDTNFVPVLLRYYTEFPDETGALRTYRDIYGLNPTALAKS